MDTALSAEAEPALGAEAEPALGAEAEPALSIEADDCPLASALIGEMASRFSRGHLCNIGLAEPRLYCLLAAVRHCCRYEQLSRQQQLQIEACRELCSSVMRGASYIREKREQIIGRAVAGGLDEQELIAALDKHRKLPPVPMLAARRAHFAELREQYPAPAGRCAKCAGRQ